MIYKLWKKLLKLFNTDPNRFWVQTRSKKFRHDVMEWAKSYGQSPKILRDKKRKELEKVRQALLDEKPKCLTEKLDLKSCIYNPKKNGE